MLRKIAFSIKRSTKIPELFLKQKIPTNVQQPKLKGMKVRTLTKLYIYEASTQKA